MGKQRANLDRILAWERAVPPWEGSHELMAFITLTGKALTHGFWKKYGSRRGYAGAYLAAHGVNVDSRSLNKFDERCVGAIYGFIRGEDAKWQVAV